MDIDPNWDDSEDNRLAVQEGVAKGYGFETTLCDGGAVAVCASDWRTVDRRWLLEIETGVGPRDWEGNRWPFSTWDEVDW